MTPTPLRRPASALALCALLSGCATPPSVWKVGAHTPVDDPQYASVTARVHGRRAAGRVPVVPTAQLRLGRTGVDLGVGMQLTWDGPRGVLTPHDALFATVGIDTFHLGRSRDFWYAGTLGPYGELGWRERDPEEPTRWWSLSLVLDHDARLGPRHRTFFGVLIGWAR